MKKHYLFLILVLFISLGYTTAQVNLPHYEAFDYPVGDSLPMHGWTGLNSGDQIFVTGGSLSYSGLAASAGNKIEFGESGRDFHKLITAQTSGTVYMSYIMKVTDLGSLDATGGYFTGFGASTTTFGGTNWVKKGPGTGFNIGVNAKSTASYTVWDNTEYSVGSVVFIVFSLEIIAGSNNDIAKMWINPAAGTFGGSSPPGHTLTVTNGAAVLSSIERIFLRQDSDLETPKVVELDEIRVGTSWAQVTPLGSGITENNDISGFKVLPSISNGKFVISFNPKTSYDVLIYNMLGVVVYNSTNMNASLPVNISDQGKGIYFVQLKDNNTSVVATKKIIIQ